MNITVINRLEAGHTRMRNAIVNRLERSLARYSRRIERVNVTLVDENGPRGGLDKLCPISVILHGASEITASAMHEKPWTAFTKAAERVQHIISRRFSRIRTRRVQERHRRTVAPGTLAADSMLAPLVPDVAEHATDITAL
ncbi:MAG: hypothetical protein ACF8TS_21165 [Maioricimonas sp. JB049]